MSSEGVSEILESRILEMGNTADEDNIVRKAMSQPVDSPILSELAKGKKTATIIISDHTRPVPSKHIIPFMLAELREGNSEIDITLLVATGCHRGTRKEELTDKLGEKVVAEEKIIIHDCDDTDSLITLGTLPSGASLVINRLAVETDLLLAEGFIEPHFFAGFSGGRKSVLPGICSRVTVLGNHCSKFIDSPYARMGKLEHNPIHEDMIAGVQMANLAYIVNVIINDAKEIVAAFAGHPIRAHEKGCEYLKSFCEVKPEQKGDIVITSNGGVPMDQNVYQAVKGISTAEAVVRENGIIIICAECADGIGGEGFYNAMKKCRNAGELLKDIREIPMEETLPDQWQYQILARIIDKHKVIFVTNPDLAEKIGEMKMEYSPSLEDAVERAKRYIGKVNDIVVIPNGISVIID